MQPFEKLDAWRLAHDLTLRIYAASRAFPDEERYGLTSQMRRAAASVGANIAEGSAAPSKREFARYLSIALRSLNETGSWLRLGLDLEYLDLEAWRRLDALRARTGKVISKLRSSLN